MSGNSEFDKWFEEQYGPRPEFSRHPSISDEGLLMLIHQGERAGGELKARLAWDNARNSALACWNAINIKASGVK